MSRTDVSKLHGMRLRTAVKVLLPQFPISDSSTLCGFVVCGDERLAHSWYQPGISKQYRHIFAQFGLRSTAADKASHVLALNIEHQALHEEGPHRLGHADEHCCLCPHVGVHCRYRRLLPANHADYEAVATVKALDAQGRFEAFG